MLPERKLVSYRMNTKVLESIELLAAHLGMNKTSVIAYCIMIVVKREKLKAK